MATVTRTTTWSSGDTLTAAALNGEFNNLLNALALGDSDISGGIAVSKISGTAVSLAGTQTLTNKTIDAASNTLTGVVTLTGTQTLSNKTLTKPTVNGSIQALTADSDGSTVTFDLAASNIHTVTLGGDRTLALSNPSVGQAFIIRLIQDGTGSRLVTWFSTIKWAGGSAPTLTTTASRIDVLSFICTSSGNYDGFIVGQNLA